MYLRAIVCLTAAAGYCGCVWGVVTLVAVLCCGCGDNKAPRADAASFCEAEVALTGGVACAIPPSATRPGTSDAFGYHAIGIPIGVTPATPLYIYFRGTGSRPFEPSTGFASTSLRILQEAIDHGRLGVVLAYDNFPGLADLCRDDLACYEAVRLEIIVGIEANDPGDFKHVRPPDDIMSRIDALVGYLHTVDAARFANEVSWPTTRLGGGSQGGGHAAFIAKQLRGVEWACNLAGLGDVDSSLQPAPWITSTTWMTPLSRMRAVIHAQDPYWDRTIASWTAFGYELDVNWRTLTNAATDPHAYPVSDDPPAKATRLWACFE